MSGPPACLVDFERFSYNLKPGWMTKFWILNSSEATLFFVVTETALGKSTGDDVSFRTETIFSSSSYTYYSVTVFHQTYVPLWYLVNVSPSQSFFPIQDFFNKLSEILAILLPSLLFIFCSNLHLSGPITPGFPSLLNNSPHCSFPLSTFTNICAALQFNFTDIT